VFVLWFRVPRAFLINCINAVKNTVSSSLFIYPIDAQLDYSKRTSKFTLKFTLKCSYMFRFNNHHKGATIRTLLKL